MMTNEQKNHIATMRSAGFTYQRIGNALGLPMSTVKTFCRRKSISPTVKKSTNNEMSDKTFCRCCGKELIQTPGKKHKNFCSKACRIKWWNSHQYMVNKKAFYTFTCVHCGKAFTIYGIAKQKYCSHACYIADRFGKEVSHDA